MNQFQRGVYQRDQDFIQHADGIQLTRRLEKQRQLLEIRRVGGNLNPGNLAQELARRVRSRVLRAEDDIGNIANSELHTIVALQPLALYPLPVDVRTMLAALVDDEKVPVFGHNERMVARHARVGNHQVLVDLAAHGKRRAVHDNRSLLVTLNVNERRKHP